MTLKTNEYKDLEEQLKQTIVEISNANTLNLFLNTLRINNESLTEEKRVKSGSGTESQRFYFEPTPYSHNTLKIFKNKYKTIVDDASSEQQQQLIPILLKALQTINSEFTKYESTADDNVLKSDIYRQLKALNKGLQTLYVEAQNKLQSLTIISEEQIKKEPISPIELPLVQSEELATIDVPQKDLIDETKQDEMITRIEEWIKLYPTLVQKEAEATLIDLLKHTPLDSKSYQFFICEYGPQLFIENGKQNYDKLHNVIKSLLNEETINIDLNQYLLAYEYSVCPTNIFKYFEGGHIKNNNKRMKSLKELGLLIKIDIYAQHKGNLINTSKTLPEGELQKTVTKLIEELGTFQTNAPDRLSQSDQSKVQILIQTNKLLNGRLPVQDYKKLAKTVQGAPSKQLQRASLLMFAISTLILGLGIILMATGAAIPGAMLAGLGGLGAVGSATLFMANKQKGLSKAVEKVAEDKEELDNSEKPSR